MLLPLTRASKAGTGYNFKLKLLNPGLAGGKPLRSAPQYERESATRLSDQLTKMRHHDNSSLQINEIADLWRSDCCIIAAVLLRVPCPYLRAPSSNGQGKLEARCTKLLLTSFETGLELRQRDIVPRFNCFDDFRLIVNEWREFKEKSR